jgi:hypothetical protein
MIKRAIDPRNLEIVDQDMADVLRQKTEAERLRIAWGMWRSARNMIRNLLRAEHPECHRKRGAN